MLKPDAVQRGLTGEIITRFERVGLKIIGVKMAWPTKEQMEKFYPSTKEWLTSVGEKARKSHEEKGVQDKRDPLETGKWVKSVLVEYASCGPVVVLALEGNSAIEIVRKLVGSTDPLKAQPGTIRGDFTPESIVFADANQRATRNLIHASGNKEEAKHEIKFWFKENELFDYKLGGEEILYSNNWTKRKKT
ncbi:nucleoside-diphosphate kinase [Candidatus Micrarchaeota archaeon]|nr:nucleoside-diphosphate kinase [Candidatus Micrarchaeota archaeon]